MIVMKFGGTSVGSAERIRHVAGLVAGRDDCFVVCSAMSGVTNTLVDTARAWESGDHDKSRVELERLKSHFGQTCYDLFNDPESSKTAVNEVNHQFDIIQERMGREYSLDEENWLLARGEIITTGLIASYMNYAGIPVTLLNALDLVQTGNDGEPSVEDLRTRLNMVLGGEPRGRYLTQGYICMDRRGQVSNLKRGGSDYTATLAGAALRAESIEIWTDIDGLRNNDPRVVENTFPVRELSFDEAAELAYFGAKILHPSCVWPASSNSIPIHLRNTLDPGAPGTVIRSEVQRKGITAVASKEEITVVRIRSDRMLNAYGFLNRIFAIFEKYRTPIDVITTSEVSVSVTIDDPRYLDEIERELSALGSVTTESGQAIVCVVGDILEQHQGRAVTILESLRHFNVKMISFGGSMNNITVVVPSVQRIDVLHSLNSFLFDNKPKATDQCLISQA